MQLSTILCPIDFSDHSTAAAQVAAAIARQFDAKLVLLHSFHIHTSMEEYAATSTITSHIQAQEQECKTKLTRLAALFKDDVQCDYVVKAGFACDEIIAAAELHQAQLIVMGTLGADSLMDRWLGSVTQSVIQEAKVPVMAIPATFVWEGFDRITLATDFKTPEPEESMDLLRAFASRFEATIQVVNVSGHPAPHTVESSAHAILLEHELAGFPHSWHQEEDRDVTHGLMTFVQAHHSDLLVMTTRRHGLFDRLFGKSHTNRMASACQIPLLSLPATS